MENLAKYFMNIVWPEDNTGWYNDIDGDTFEIVQDDRCPSCGADLHNTLVCTQCGYYDNE
jgi:hypothetical protein